MKRLKILLCIAVALIPQACKTHKSSTSKKIENAIMDSSAVQRTVENRIVNNILSKFEQNQLEINYSRELKYPESQKVNDNSSNETSDVIEATEWNIDTSKFIKTGELTATDSRNPKRTFSIKHDKKTGKLLGVYKNNGKKKNIKAKQIAMISDKTMLTIKSASSKTENATNFDSGWKSFQSNINLNKKDSASIDTNVTSDKSFLTTTEKWLIAIAAIGLSLYLFFYFKNKNK